MPSSARILEVSIHSYTAPFREAFDNRSPYIRIAIASREDQDDPIYLGGFLRHDPFNILNSPFTIQNPCPLDRV